MTNRSERATARGGGAGRQGGPTASDASISLISYTLGSQVQGQPRMALGMKSEKWVQREGMERRDGTFQGPSVE